MMKNRILLVPCMIWLCFGMSASAGLGERMLEEVPQYDGVEVSGKGETSFKSNVNGKDVISNIAADYTIATVTDPFQLEVTLDLVFKAEFEEKSSSYDMYIEKVSDGYDIYRDGKFLSNMNDISSIWKYGESGYNATNLYSSLNDIFKENGENLSVVVDGGVLSEYMGSLFPNDDEILDFLSSIIASSSFEIEYNVDSNTTLPKGIWVNLIGSKNDMLEDISITCNSTISYIDIKIENPKTSGTDGPFVLENEKDVDYIEAGLYAVGEDIPAGEYIILANISGECILNISEEQKSDGTLQMISSLQILDLEVINLEEGTTIELLEGKMVGGDKVLLNKECSPRLRVGKDIEKGTYMVKSVDPSKEATWSIDAKDGVVSSNSFKGTSDYFYVENGDLLTLLNCRIV